MPEVASLVAEFDTAQRAHHPDSPSSLQASEACAGFVNEQRESAASEAGTLQHKATETRDYTILENEAQVVAVEKCIFYEDAVLAVYQQLELERGLTVCTEAESYLAVGDDKVEEFLGVTGGFPDKIIRNTEEADILDWKFGKVPVTPTKDNVQGISYALGAFQKWPSLKKVTVHFYAPYQGWSEEEHNSKYVHPFHRSEITALELRIRTIIAKKKIAQAAIAKDDWQYVRPCMDLCLWCTHKGACKPMHAVVLKPAEKHPDFVVPATVNHMELTRADQFKTAFRWANQLDPIVKAVKKRCCDAVLTEDLDLGDDMKVVRRVERKITSVQGVVDTAVEHGLTPEEITETLSVPITKIEDAIKKKAPKGQGAAAIRAFNTDLAERGITVPGTPVYFLQEVKSPADKKQQNIEIEG